LNGLSAYRDHITTVFPTDDELKAINNGAFTNYVIIGVLYEDGEGRHATQFCGFFDKNQNLIRCNKYNATS
jgi:hypothetical protein